jgi:hypothetical protein
MRTVFVVKPFRMSRYTPQGVNDKLWALFIMYAGVGPD